MATNSIEILLAVIAVNAIVLAIAAFGLYRLNKAVDAFDH
jgi:hypothetical protein